MLQDAIKKSKIEKEKDIVFSIEIKENIYGELNDIAKDNNIEVTSLCRNIIETSVENELNSSNMITEKEIAMNVWIISSKYLDATEDLTQECITNSEIRMGWYNPAIVGLSRVDREDILLKTGKKKASGKLDYFFNSMKEGDFVIMKEGTNKVHAIVQISSECQDGKQYYYRKIKKLIIIKDTKVKDIAKLYEKFFIKSLNRTTIYKKKISKNDFFTFMVESLAEIN
ncbi:MAG: hypothetical protein Q9M36_08165 [Sulfurovum sp.]|nr:hypothetical protein [Sulfurovum sp.]